MLLMDLLEVFSNGDCMCSAIPVVDASYASAKEVKSAEEAADEQRVRDASPKKNGDDATPSAAVAGGADDADDPAAKRDKSHCNWRVLGSLSRRSVLQYMDLALQFQLLHAGVVNAR